jgi:hypothetical protein
MDPQTMRRIQTERVLIAKQWQKVPERVRESFRGGAGRGGR